MDDLVELVREMCVAANYNQNIREFVEHIARMVYSQAEAEGRKQGLEMAQRIMEAA